MGIGFVVDGGGGGREKLASRVQLGVDLDAHGQLPVVELLIVCFSFAGVCGFASDSSLVFQLFAEGDAGTGAAAGSV